MGLGVCIYINNKGLKQKTINKKKRIYHLIENGHKGQQVLRKEDIQMDNNIRKGA